MSPAREPCARAPAAARRLAAAAACCAALVAAPCVAAPEAVPRWREHAYGLSLRPPAGATLMERADDDVVPWSLAGAGAMQMSLRDLQARMRLAPIRTQLELQGRPNDRALLERIGRDRTIAPRGQARMLAHSTDDAAVRIVGDVDYTISVYIRSMPADWHIHQVAAAGMGQVATVWPAATVLEERKFEAAGQPAALIYYRLPETQGEPIGLAECFVQISSSAFALLQLETPYGLLPHQRPAFEAVLDSLELAPPAAIKQRRKALLDRGAMWLEMLDGRSLKAAIGPTQLLRLQRGSDDIGYMTIASRTATELGLPGLAIVVQARMLDGPYAYDADSRFFLSDDMTHEMWSINTTARLAHGHDARDGEPPTALSWAETGMRFEDRIEVTRQGHDHTAPATRVWTRPTGYLSLVQVHLLDRLVPVQRPQEMGFYAYIPSANEMAFCTVRVEPQDDGGYRIVTRPSPERGATVSAYDRDRRLLWRLLPGGRRILRTTSEQFQKIWGKQ